jgi:putative membrane protein
MSRPTAAHALALLSIAALAAMAVPAGAQATTAAPSASDRAFMMRAARTNIAEIAGGRLAQQRGCSPTVRLLGQRFADDRRANQQQLAALAQSLDVTLPTQPSLADQRALKRLTQLRGSAFDAAFLSSERLGNMKSINALKAEITSSASAPVVAYAKASLPLAGGRPQLVTDTANTSGAPENSGTTGDAGSPAITTSSATGAGQMSGKGTPDSPSDGAGTMPGSATGPGR